MFKRIQWTFGIYFLNANYMYLVSLHHCLFYSRVLWVVSGSVKAIHMPHDTEVTD